MLGVGFVSPLLYILTDVDGSFRNSDMRLNLHACIDWNEVAVCKINIGDIPIPREYRKYINFNFVWSSLGNTLGIYMMTSDSMHHKSGSLSNIRSWLFPLKKLWLCYVIIVTKIFLVVRKGETPSLG